MDSENIFYVSRFNVYEDTKGAIVVATSPRISPNSNHVSEKYHWFRQHVGNKILIGNI